MATNALSVRMQSPEFAALPSEERASVIVLEDVMRQIDTAANKLAVCKEWALRNGHRRGWSADRLRAKYYGWVASGRAWTFLVDQARVAGHATRPAPGGYDPRRRDVARRVGQAVPQRAPAGAMPL